MISVTLERSSEIVRPQTHNSVCATSPLHYTCGFNLLSSLHSCNGYKNFNNSFDNTHITQYMSCFVMTTHVCLVSCVAETGEAV